MTGVAAGAGAVAAPTSGSARLRRAARRAIGAVAAGALTGSALAGTPTHAVVEPMPFAPTPASQTGPIPAAACDRAAVAAMLGTGVSVASVETTTGPAAACRVRGTLVTSGEGAPPGSARFELNMPANWNRKLLFLGGGGFDGNVPRAPADRLAKGYATLGTDSGHVQDPRYPGDGLDASWAVGPDGRRATAQVADYAHRSRHQVNARLRPLLGWFYGAPVERAYFIGCSGGGREALVEAERHPEDYDGFVAGNPVTSMGTAMLAARNFRTLLAAPIPYARFPAIDRAVLADCDARDGVSDGLIQNPAACAFDPAVLVASGDLDPAQARALTSYLSAPRDDRGRRVGFGGTVSGMGDLSGVLPGATGGFTGLSVYLTDGIRPVAGDLNPWGPLPAGPVNWLLFNGTIGAIGMARPGLSVLDPEVTSADGTLSARVVDETAARIRDGLVDPTRMGRFLASGSKLIIYHGYDDTILDPYSTIATYAAIAKAGGGLARTQRSARLFMVPGMGHCGGGPGPNVFDALGAMEAWVEHGKSPDALVASHFPNGRPAPGVPADRTMPICPFPAAARHDGVGDPKAAGSWSCPPNDRRLAEAGPNGAAAGIAPILERLR